MYSAYSLSLTGIRALIKKKKKRRLRGTLIRKGVLIRRGALNRSIRYIHCKKFVCCLNLSFQDEVDSSIFFLGGSGSGVSFHKHADAWNGVIFGRKRWFLYPPQKTPSGGKVERALM